MAPTTYTPAEAPSHGPDLVEGLIDLYARERGLYQEVLRLSRDQAALVRDGRGLGDIKMVLEAKRQRLDEIARLERGSTEARRYWEQRRDALAGAQSARLQQSLQVVGDLIESILQIEAENDRLFMNMAERGG